ncbi:peptidylprolyl isomerase [Mesonia sp. K7]|uniref:peptidylprolyl isomerase n=1 Tax=Mesonia sp. K7 TaxID=2218606 RepID=UPI000DA90207|nr:peptidylprolyl isomerase [Mesonia sp. K7]PZD77775.1 peptidylprolyl isomerase [Mesonia sp. K7]
MAVLNKIRQRSVFLIIIIALALFSFVLADVIRSGGFTKTQNNIATINGEEISQKDFAARVEAYQQNSGGSMTTAQAVNQVWNAQLNQTLLDEQIDELGIQVGEDQINEALEQQFGNSPEFMNNEGFFDLGKVKEYVANLEATSPQAYEQWKNVEKNIENQAKSRIYYNMVRAGVGATLIEGEQIHKMENDKVNFNFVMVPYESAGEIEVSKDDIQAYLNDHKEKYEVEATRDIQYVFFEETASTKDENDTKAELEKLLNDRKEFNEVSKINEDVKGFRTTENLEQYIAENSDLPYEERYLFKDELPTENADRIFETAQGETYGSYRDQNFWKAVKVTDVKQIPDSVQVRHILLAFEGSPVSQEVTRTKEQAEKLADSLLTVIKKDKEQFGTLATTYTDDSSTKAKNGELGWVNYRNVSSSKFMDYIFDTESNDYGVIEMEYGYHIVNIQERKNVQKAIQVATIAKEIEPSEETTNDLFATTTKFEIAAKEGSFTDEAKKNSYEVRPVKDIKAMDESFPGIGNQRGIVKWAFNEDTEVGDVSRFDLSNGYVVAQVTAKNKKGLMSVESASPTVTPIIRKEKQAEAIIKKIDTSKTLGEIASVNGVSVQTASQVNMSNPVLPGSTNEPKVVGTAFYMPKGKVSKPIQGEKGVFVVEVTNKTEATKLDTYKTIANRKSKEQAGKAVNRLLEALKSSAEIEDNRATFY